MKYRFPLAALFASAGFVAQAEADNFTEMVVRDLLDNGFTHIEVARSASELWAEGRGADGSIELLYDRETGAILSEERRYDDQDEDEAFEDIEIAIRDVDEEDDREDEEDDDDDDDDDEDGDESDDEEEDEDDAVEDDEEREDRDEEDEDDEDNDEDGGDEDGEDD
ncbi:MAG: hypothetical protein AAGB18_03400 [Pseudomonadota bacterium]